MIPCFFVHICQFSPKKIIYFLSHGILQYTVHCDKIESQKAEKEARACFAYCKCTNRLKRKGKVIIMNSQLKRGTLELCVLAVLSRRDCYGYELVNEISDCIHITEGTIYPLMKRLKDDGSITSYLVESREGPPRKYYSITDIGRAKLKEQLDEWNSFYASVNKILEKSI